MTPTNPTRFTPEHMRDMAKICESSDYELDDVASALRQAADDAERLAAAEADVQRMDQLELSQRADVAYQGDGEPVLIGYEWGCGGEYSSARDALDAAIAARNPTKEG